jgi:hypothetical protein
MLHAYVASRHHRQLDDLLSTRVPFLPSSPRLQTLAEEYARALEDQNIESSAVEEYTDAVASISAVARLICNALLFTRVLPVSASEAASVLASGGLAGPLDDFSADEEPVIQHAAAACSRRPGCDLELRAALVKATLSWPDDDTEPTLPTGLSAASAAAEAALEPNPLGLTLAAVLDGGFSPLLTRTSLLHPLAVHRAYLELVADHLADALREEWNQYTTGGDEPFWSNQMPRDAPQSDVEAVVQRVALSQVPDRASAIFDPDFPRLLLPETQIRRKDADLYAAYVSARNAIALPASPVEFPLDAVVGITPEDVAFLYRIALTVAGVPRDEAARRGELARIRILAEQDYTLNGASVLQTPKRGVAIGITEAVLLHLLTDLRPHALSILDRGEAMTPGEAALYARVVQALITHPLCDAGALHGARTAYRPLAAELAYDSLLSKGPRVVNPDGQFHSRYIHGSVMAAGRVSVPVAADPPPLIEAATVQARLLRTLRDDAPTADLPCDLPAFENLRARIKRENFHVPPGMVEVPAGTEFIASVAALDKQHWLVDLTSGHTGVLAALDDDIQRWTELGRDAMLDVAGEITALRQQQASLALAEAQAQEASAGPLRTGRLTGKANALVARSIRHPRFSQEPGGRVEERLKRAADQKRQTALKEVIRSLPSSARGTQRSLLNVRRRFIVQPGLFRPLRSGAVEGLGDCDGFWLSLLVYDSRFLDTAANQDPSAMRWIDDLGYSRHAVFRHQLIYENGPRPANNPSALSEKLYVRLHSEVRQYDDLDHLWVHFAQRLQARYQEVATDQRFYPGDHTEAVEFLCRLWSSDPHHLHYRVVIRRNTEVEFVYLPPLPPSEPAEGIHAKRKELVEVVTVEPDGFWFRNELQPSLLAVHDAFRLALRNRIPPPPRDKSLATLPWARTAVPPPATSADYMAFEHQRTAAVPFTAPGAMPSAVATGWNPAAASWVTPNPVPAAAASWTTTNPAAAMPTGTPAWGASTQPMPANQWSGAAWNQTPATAYQSTPAEMAWGAQPAASYVTATPTGTVAPAAMHTPIAQAYSGTPAWGAADSWSAPTATPSGPAQSAPAASGWEMADWTSAATTTPAYPAQP